MARRKRKFAGKRAVGRDGIVHGFFQRKDRYGMLEFLTFCGEPVGEIDTGLDARWKIVSPRPITCIRCVAWA